MAAPVPLPSDLTEAQQERRARIVEAGLELLQEREYDQVQVKDVAEHAGVALGTFYRYFPSKERLFAEVLVVWAGTLRTHVSRRPLRGTTNAERLTEVLHRSVRAFQRQPQLARLVATLEVSSDPFATEILARLGETTNPIYTEALVGVDPDTAHAIVRVVDAVLAQNIRSWVSGRITAPEMFDRLAEAAELLAPH